MSTSTAAGARPWLAWLARAHQQVTQWALQASWGRMLLLWLVVVIAASTIGNLFNLEHETVRVKSSSKPQDVIVTIENGGVRVRRVPPEGAASAPQRDASTPGTTVARVTVEDDAVKSERKRINTVRGYLGDLGGALVVILFAYLAATKVIGRKVAQAEAKVASAMGLAEREAVERQLAQAQLQVLQAQVEPHFLFNTLAAVDYLIQTDAPRASRMQRELINYLRCALPQMREETSTLGREVALVRSYLELIKMRIEDRLTLEYRIPPELEHARFPPMMLQSLVENAIKHGIEPKPEGGTVAISASVRQNMLWVEVKDTGVGFQGDEDMLEGPRPDGGGIGLANIRERLAVMYRGKARFTLRSDDETGTVVRIAVPLSLATPAADNAAPAAEGATP